MRIKEIKDLLKELISKKHVANIIVILAVAIIALIFSSDFLVKDSSAKNNIKETVGDTFVKQEEVFKTEEEIVEVRLKKILERIKGSGEVEVMVTFEMGSEIIPASNTVETKDTTEEKDSNGGIRTVTSQNLTENIVTTNDNTGNKPLVIKEIKPRVKGVIVVAEGADDIEVKMQLYDAVKTVLQVSGDRVQVYTRN
ncbi:stage III sporulation protein AG [Alkaliphilus sp. B6464]|uniref:stage III sporulation protein AG n=1 Tax=Alkaliphilus sp. B6464 TaxID=2731219 RepID=UPI001BAC2C9C|nr:stage III sporulation protein AG [Alkaliphilus sp. B6464]QUH20693.1 stage III sporulation protein AG [Alkaliphilus sp. B6464]